MPSLESLQKLVEQKRALKSILEKHPLREARLWHQPLPRTSQRRCLQDVGELITVVCGGNRAGKAELGAMYAVAVAMGRTHPDALAWCINNHLDPNILPPYPGSVWAVGLDSGDSKEYIRPKVDKYLPPGSKWRNRDGFGRAEVRLPDGGRIMFPSVDQGRDGFQGSTVDLVWFDEEPNDEAVVNECLIRLVDRHGAKMMLTLTPLRGMTWLHDRWVAQPSDDVRVHWVHGEDNIHLPAGALNRILRQYGAHERAARERGEWTTLEGRVYQDFRRDLHVVPSFHPPDDWERVAAIDFGTRNPACILLGAVDPSDDTLHLIDEHYRAEWTLRQHAAAYRRMIATHPPPVWFVADPADRGARLSLAREHDIQTVGALKKTGSVRAGINAVSERLAPDVEGRPHLLIHDRCVHTIREFEQYVWATTNTKNDLPDAPRKKNDHAMDALAYMCFRLNRATFGVG